MRVLFAGTPSTAVPTLLALLESSHDVVGVLTRPDARSGRGRRPATSPVKLTAIERGLPVLQPRHLNEPGALEAITDLRADVAAVVAYGSLLPPAALAALPRGWINVHFSLLPAWRGAAPVQHAIWAGDDIGGVSVIQLEEGLDTGPILSRLTETIRPTDTSGALLDRLAQAGAGLLVRTFDALEAGRIVPEAQSPDGVSLAPRIRVEDAKVDWNQPAYRVDRLVRAMTPEPGAWTCWRESRLKVRPGRVEAAAAGADLAPGEVRVGRHEVWVGTGQGGYRLTEVAPAGKGWMAADAWARGARPAQGEKLGDQGDETP